MVYDRFQRLKINKTIDKIFLKYETFFFKTITSFEYLLFKIGNAFTIRSGKPVR